MGTERERKGEREKDAGVTIMYSSIDITPNSTTPDIQL